MTDIVRKVERTFPGKPTLEGAGVRLRRSFSNQEVRLLDPFLLLDSFGSANPEDYLAGFPWHPHRGIETVTYMLEGNVEHGDTLGNSGVIGPGDVQWMRSGSGIIHQEMPKRAVHELRGFQLWLNMPSRLKSAAPAYHGISTGEIPKVDSGKGITVRIVAGSYDRVEGPVRDLPTEPQYLDVTLEDGVAFEHRVTPGHTAFAHLVRGEGTFDAAHTPVHAGETALFGDGDIVRAQGKGLRFLLVSGKPLHEPIAWYGPIVMNTEDEIATAIHELRHGDFIKEKNATTGP